MNKYFDPYFKITFLTCILSYRWLYKLFHKKQGAMRMFTFNSKFFRGRKCFTFYYHMNMVKGSINVGRQKTLFSERDIQQYEWRRVSAAKCIPSG